MYFNAPVICSVAHVKILNSKQLCILTLGLSAFYYVHRNVSRLHAAAAPAGTKTPRTVFSMAVQCQTKESHVHVSTCSSIHVHCERDIS